MQFRRQDVKGGARVAAPVRPRPRPRPQPQPQLQPQYVEEQPKGRSYAPVASARAPARQRQEDESQWNSAEGDAQAEPPIYGGVMVKQFTLHN